MGAALAYYTLFSIAPLLLIVISIAGLVFGEDAARGEIFAELRDLIGERRRGGGRRRCCRASTSRRRACSARSSASSALLIGATTVFGELQDALDRIWRAPARAGSVGAAGRCCARACCRSAWCSASASC